MPQSDLVSLLASTSVQDLKTLITAKARLDKLTLRKVSLEKQLADVEREIRSVRTSLGRRAARKSGTRFARASSRQEAGTVRRPSRPAGGRASQPSIQSLIVQILQERGKALSVNDLADALLNEKKYKTRSSNFKNQLRVLLYRNRKGLFRKVGEGMFALAGDKAAATKPSRSAAGPAARRTPTAKRQPRKTAPPARARHAKKKPDAGRNAQPSLKTLIVEVLDRNKRAMSIQEISDAILQGKHVPTQGKNLRSNVGLVLYGDRKGIFRKVNAGRFVLA